MSIIPVVLLISVIAFSLLYLLPGDPALAILGPEGGADQKAYTAMRQQLGLDDPVYVQYARWLGNLVHGDMGTSVRSKEPVADLVTRRLVVTAQLGLAAVLIALLIAFPVAIVSAIRPFSKWDMAGTIFAMAGIGMPSFWLGIMLIYIFAVWLRWLPPSGYTPPLDNFGASLRMMAMPSLVLGMNLAAVIMRQTRSALIEVLQEDYIRTAWAKGLGERLVVSRHALRNALIPVVTIIGLQVGHVFGGAVITETIFALPGLGRLMVDSASFRDYPVVQGAILVMALGVLLSNLLTDIAYAYLDPRIRFS